MWIPTLQLIKNVGFYKSYLMSKNIPLDTKRSYLPTVLSFDNKSALQCTLLEPNV